MSEPGLLRRAATRIAETVSWIHTGEEDMRTVYGENPNNTSDAAKLASAGLMFWCLLGASGV